MTPSQLRTLLAVVETGTVHGAADRLVVSQPAVSSALASLRRELGVNLFEREGRGLRVTPAGEVLADYGRRVLGLLDEAAVATVARADPERGRLRLAAVTTAGEHVVPQMLSALLAAHPAVEIVLEVGNRRRVWELLDGRHVDVAITGRPPVEGGLVTLATRDHELVVVAPPSGSRSGRPRAITLLELANRTWLLREPGSGTRATTEEVMTEMGIAPATLTLGSNGAICESVKAGLGVALVSRDAVASELAGGSLEEWRAEPLPLRRQWHLVVRAREELPATASLFVEMMAGRGREAQGRFTRVNQLGGSRAAR
jgi:LysR family transcriptional regulator, low CO2-responsive transcriptional regulator